MPTGSDFGMIHFAVDIADNIFPVLPIVAV